MAHLLTVRIRRYLRRIHPWYFLVLTILFGTISIIQLRHNNEGMVVKREAVFAADKHNGDVEGALRDLRQYVYGHMNTSLTSGKNAVYPPIQLKYTYERAQAEQQAKLGPGNSSLYHEAESACEQQVPSGIASDVIACIESYTAARGIDLTSVPDALYKFDFTSAKWSPDLAGFSVVATILCFVLFWFTALYVRITRRWL